MLWVLKRTVSMRRFFWAPKTYAKNFGWENIYNFMLKFFVYLNLWLKCSMVYTGLEKIFLTYSSFGASGLNFPLVLTPVELVLKSGILIQISS